MPHPQALHLELRSLHAVYLILPTSAETREVHRFQAYQGSDTLGRLEFEQILDAMRQGATPFFGHPGNLAAIRRFYAAWRNERQEVPPALLIRQLQEDVRHGALAVFRFARDPHRSMIRGDAGSGVLPGRGPVSGWSGGQKVVAMFEAIPECLGEASRAEFRAFLTPQNLAVMALFFGGIAVVQALPGADAIVDGMIAGLAWWQFGWAGLIAGKDFVEAVIKAGHATTGEEIKLAAKLAAAALVSLGLLVLLREIVRRVHEVKPKAPEAEDEPLPPKSPRQQVLAAYPARGSTDDIMQRYNNGNDGVTYPRRADQFTPDSVYDSTAPAADQRTAINQLQSQLDSSGNPAWDDDKIDQILNSGSKFGTNDYSAGDNIYKIQNLGYNPDTPSPYILDQNGMNQLINQGYVDENLNVTNAAGVKQYLALPCYNMAQTIFQGQVTAPTTGVTSQINSASELFNLDNGAGGVDEGKLLMTGGGSQVSLPPSAVSFGK